MNFVPFISYVFINCFTPGPNNILAMSNAQRFGVKRSLGFLWGMLFGSFISMFLCGYLNLVLAKIMPQIQFVLSVLGSLYILYLALKIAFSSVSEDPSSDSNGSAKTTKARTGFIVQFLNPKAILFGITAFSVFIIPHYSTLTSIILFSIILDIIGVTATLTWLLFGAILNKVFKKYNRIINIVMAVLLVYCAISIWQV